MNCHFLFQLFFAFLSFSSISVSSAETKHSIPELKSLAEASLSKNDLNTAITYYSQLLQLEPTQLNYFHRATAYLKQHKYSNALHDLGLAIESDASFIKGYIYRAKINKLTGRCDNALKDINTILSLQSSHKEANSEKPKIEQCVRLVNQATDLYNRKFYENAKQKLNEALDIAYDSHTLLLMRAKCHYYLGDYQSVLVDTRKILQSDKTNIDTLLLRGLAYYSIGEHDTAQTHLKEALKLDPEHREVVKEAKKLKNYLKHLNEIDPDLERKQYKSALQHINSALEIDPEHRVKLNWLYTKKCEALVGLKQGKEAITACNQALEIDDNSIDSYIARGSVHILQEEWQQAVNDYTKATQIDQHNHRAQEGLQNAQRLLKVSLQKDYYKTLGIPRDANDRQIKKAFRKLALQYHPDKHKGDENKEDNEKKFREIGEAYEVLSNPETRAKYDRGEELKPGGGGGPQQHQGGFPFGGFPFGGFGQGGGGGGGGQQFHFNFGG